MAIYKDKHRRYLQLAVAPALFIAGAIFLFLISATEEGAKSVSEQLWWTAKYFTFSMTLYVALSVWSTRLATIFYTAFVVRLAVIFILFGLLSPPAVILHQFSITTPFVPIWNDEVNYLSGYYNIRGFSYAVEDLFDGINSGPVLDKVARISLIHGFVFDHFGEHVASLRVFSSLLGAATVAIIAKNLVVFGMRPRGPLFWILILAGPGFLQSSVLIYKEALVQLGAALAGLALSMAAVRRSFDLGIAFSAASAVAILTWSRLDFLPITVSIIFILTLLCLRVSGIRFWRTVALTLVLVVASLLVLYPEAGSQDIMAARETADALQGTSFGWASGASGLLSFVHVPISVFNPPTFWLHNYIVPSPGEKSWFVPAVVELRTVQWWLALAGLAVGTQLALRRAPAIVVMAFPFFLLFIAAPLIYNGVGPEVVRYRDSFLPAAAIIAFFGYRSAKKTALRRAVTLTILAGLSVSFIMNFR